MEIAKGIEMLQLEFQEFVIHPILLWDDEMAVLIDTGFPGQIEDIQVEMEKVGVSFDKLKVVILTHQDIDHIGSLPELLQRCRSNIKVYAHELPYCGGILILHTPGHTPGHISLYLKQSKILIAGDSMYSVNGMLGGIHAPTTINIKEAQQSLKKYLNLHIESVVCYHGGFSKGNINVQLQNL